MKKTDLQVGMVVETRCMGLYMVMPVDEPMEIILASYNGWASLANYNDDLTHRANQIFDIVKVYGFTSYETEPLEFELDNRKLLWERKEETKKMTVAEIENILGYKIEVVSES